MLFWQLNTDSYSSNFQDTKKVKHELFCALSAVNRLDYIAETFFNGTSSLNGYFVRDDVPDNFIASNYTHFNYYNNGANPVNNNQPARGFMSKFQTGANKEGSSLKSWITFTNSAQWNGGNGPVVGNGPIPEMSQDQAISILYGLTFVKKFVPNWETDGGATFGSGSGQTSLTTESENIADRIIKHIRTSKDLSGSTCLTNITTGWYIKNPVNCNPVGYNHDNSHNGWGDDAELFAYAFAEAGCVIKSGLFGGSQGKVGLAGDYPKLCGGVLYPNSYHNLYSASLGDNAWQALASNIIPGNGDNRLHVVNLSAICDCVYGRVEDYFWQELITIVQQIPIIGNVVGIIIGYIQKIVQYLTTHMIPGYFVNTTSTSINVNSYAQYLDFDHAPLSRKVLHGGIYQENTDYNFKYLVDAAPCDDIYFLPNENPPFAHEEWSASDRIEHPRQRRNNLGNEVPSKGEYSGLDYLLYHNLWYMHQKQKGVNQNIFDLSDVYLKSPVTTITAGNINAYETITTESTSFNFTIPTYWRAGKTITYGPGTTIVGVNNLHAYIQKFDCATDNGAFRTNTEESSAYVYPDKPYHHVDYPNQTAINSGESNTSDNQSYITELPNDDVITTDNIAVNVKEFSVYPNPASNTTKIYFSLNDKETAKVVVTDLIGKVILEKENLSNINNGNEIDLKELSIGSYLVNYSTSTGTTKSVKLIKVN